jgi:hypothetical protein
MTTKSKKRNDESSSKTSAIVPRDGLADHTAAKKPYRMSESPPRQTNPSQTGEAIGCPVLPFGDPDTSYYGFTFDTFESYSAIHADGLSTTTFPIFKASYLRTHLDNPLVSSIRSGRWPVLCDILDILDFRICIYLHVSRILFFIPDVPLAELASTIVFLISEAKGSCVSCMFTAICSGERYSDWIQLETLCCHPAELDVCPRFCECLWIWNTTRICGVVCPDSAFHESCELATDNKGLGMIPLLYLFLDEFTQSKVLCARALEVRLTLEKEGSGDREADSAGGELFVEDSEKYDLYERGIREALAVKPNAVVGILGAGRGALGDRALKAGARRIFVIENNPIGICFLRDRPSGLSEAVQLFEGEVRAIELPEKVDILITDLCGGFGDDELVLEYFAASSHLLAPGALLIPARYSSLMVPIMSDFLWSSAYHKNETDEYSIAKLVRSTHLATEKECITFTHPGDEALYQQVRLEFNVENPGTLHGFGGWFQCVLFGDVMLTNHPEVSSKSFSQLFFPIQLPIPVERGTKIVLCFERKTNKRNVWYEWFLLEPEVTCIQNPGGCHRSLKLSWEFIEHKRMTN